MLTESVALSDEVGQVAELAEFHYQVYMGSGLLTTDQSNDMWMVEVSQNLDLRVEVLFQLLVQLLQVDRFNSDVTRLFLQANVSVSTSDTEVWGNEHSMNCRPGGRGLSGKCRELLTE